MDNEQLNCYEDTKFPIKLSVSMPRQDSVDHLPSYKETSVYKIPESVQH